MDWNLYWAKYSSFVQKSINGIVICWMNSYFEIEEWVYNIEIWIFKFLFGVDSRMTSLEALKIVLVFLISVGVGIDVENIGDGFC